MISPRNVVRKGMHLGRYWFNRRPGTEPNVYAKKLQTVGERVFRIPESEVFFGYHDRTPFSADNRFLLAHVFRGNPSIDAPRRHMLEIGVFDLEMDPSDSRSFRLLGRTSTWSWQQTSMACWNPANPSGQFFYNRMGKDGPETVVCECRNGKELNRWPVPFYAVSPNGQSILSLDFGRLALNREGYGFPVLLDKRGPSTMDNSPSLLTLLDLDSGDSRVILDLDSCASSVGSRNARDHYFNHTGFSGDGRFVSVFHVHESSSGRKIRMWFVDLESGKKTVLDPDRLVSHYCWISPSSILVTNRDEKLTWRYSTYDVDRKEWLDLECPLNRDGHPMSHPASGQIVTDAVPDQRRDQQVFVANSDLQEMRQVTAIHAPSSFTGPLRCDLHPRFSPDGSLISVDRVSRGRRAMSVLDTGSTMP